MSGYYVEITETQYGYFVKLHGAYANYGSTHKSYNSAKQAAKIKADECGLHIHDQVENQATASYVAEGLGEW